MKALRTVTVALALLLALGEIARWWGQWRFLPMALDDLLIAAALLWGVALIPKKGTGPLLAAWGLFSGLTIGLLIPTVDHMLFGPPKESAVFYGIVLGGLLIIGIWGMVTSYRLMDREPSRP